MANRLLLGLKSGNYGLWISKPGVNVLTADPTSLANFLLSTSHKAFQVMYASSVACNVNNTVGVTIPDYGFKPIIVCSSVYYTDVRYNSNTSIEFHSREGDNAGWAVPNWPPSNIIYYAVTIHKMV